MQLIKLGGFVVGIDQKGLIRENLYMCAPVAQLDRAVAF